MLFKEREKGVRNFLIDEDIFLDKENRTSHVRKTTTKCFDIIYDINS